MPAAKPAVTAIHHPLAELLSMLDASPEPHIILDPDYRIIGANTAYRKQIANGEGVIGRNCFQVSCHHTQPCDRAGESCPLGRCLASGRRERVLHLSHTANGDEYRSIELTPIRDGGGEIRYFVEKIELQSVAERSGARQLIGGSKRFGRMMDLASRVAKADAVVLLEGESGSGKELVAQAIHQMSRRAKRPFVAVDCSGIPESLFESELFGHERGAFTGAVAARVGLVEAANGGTLFLDEVGEIPLSMQVKLLRLLETSAYRRVGSSEPRRADIRVISATHRSLREMVAAGSFRADLYYRLNIFPIEVPALRERQDDLPALIAALLARVAPGRSLQLSAAAMKMLAAYSFPGNVRELRNLLERASLISDGEVIEVEHLPAEVWDAAPVARAGAEEPDLAVQLEGHKGSRKKLALALGISERTLYRRLKALSES
jgi:transcriptional regulator with PAS, ATPase and Fis domain